MNRIALLAAAALLTVPTGAALAQQGKGADGAPLTKDQKDHAVQTFGVISSALRSDKIDDSVKSALMGCVYGNSLGTISGAVDKVIADNPGKVDRNDPDALLGVIAAVCGYQPTQAAAAPSAGAAKPTAKPVANPARGTAPTGR